MEVQHTLVMPQLSPKTYEFPIPAAPAAKVSADIFVHLILHPASGLIANIANVGREL